jgi:uncharacterized membrane protein (UPF0127 family)
MQDLMKIVCRTTFTTTLILISSLQSLVAAEITFSKTKLLINSHIYSLEIAKTQDQRQHGLMFRKKLASKNGMVFVYPNSNIHYIWMKNTKIKLTVIWINKGGEVVDIKRLNPCLQNPCRVFGLNYPSKYIIELNHQPHDIKIGDLIRGLDQL